MADSSGLLGATVLSTIVCFRGESTQNCESTQIVRSAEEGGIYSPKQIREDSKKIADAYGSGGVTINPANKTLSPFSTRSLDERFANTVGRATVK
jgi:hypothetical protein